MTIDPYFKFILPIVKEAGLYIKTSSSHIKVIETKSSPTDLVTEVDKNVEKMIIEKIKNEYPQHKFIGEESAEIGKRAEFTDEPTWILDPVDGTMNFIHSNPKVAISIALAIDKQIILGIIYNPFEDKLYSAKRGEGAYCNGQQLCVSNQTDVKKSLILIEAGGQKVGNKLKVFNQNLEFLLSNCHGIRWQGSAALDMCSVASGQSDAYFQFGIHCWDIAAGYLIVTEAGGVCVDTEGGPLDIMNRRVLCTASRPLQVQLSQSLKHIQLESD